MLSVLLTALTWAPSAHAADAYLCEPDNVVYVELENLEAMKRSDPCIASYYGLTVAPKPVAKPEAPPRSSQPARVAPLPAPILGRRPRLVSDELVAPSPLAVSKHRVEPSLALPVVAADGTDYRNVRVINAHATSDAWFHH